MGLRPIYLTKTIRILIMKNRFIDIISLCGFSAFCLFISAIGGAVTLTSVNSWYQDLIKPSFTPPDWVFSPVWITLYLLMGISAWLVWRQTDHKSKQLPLSVFGVQLALNLAWSFIFFGARLVGWALIEISFLWVAIVINIYLFWRINNLAGWLLIPYILWVTFAVILNSSIYVLNL
jgi:benzodiazapine receptor